MSATPDVEFKFNLPLYFPLETNNNYITDNYNQNEANAKNNNKNKNNNVDDIDNDDDDGSEDDNDSDGVGVSDGIDSVANGVAGRVYNDFKFNNNYNDYTTIDSGLLFQY